MTTISKTKITQEQQVKLFQFALDGIFDYTITNRYPFGNSDMIIARENSYSPYSKFRVGAALLSEDGTIFKGCNVENASYGAAICAERTAFVKAVSEGHRQFVALAVSTDQSEFISPCGICRQFISEFSSAEMPVYFLNNKGEHKEYTFGQLLPFAFGLDEAEKYLI